MPSQVVHAGTRTVVSMEEIWQEGVLVRKALGTFAADPDSIRITSTPGAHLRRRLTASGVATLSPTFSSNLQLFCHNRFYRGTALMVSACIEKRKPAYDASGALATTPHRWPWARRYPSTIHISIPRSAID